MMSRDKGADPLHSSAGSPVNQYLLYLSHSMEGKLQYLQHHRETEESEISSWITVWSTLWILQILGFFFLHLNYTCASTDGLPFSTVYKYLLMQR